MRRGWVRVAASRQAPIPRHRPPLWGRLRLPRCLAKFCFRRAAVGRGLADAGICQNGLRNRIVDRKPLSPNFSSPRGHERKNRSDSKKLHSAASNESWFPHIVGKAEKSVLNIMKYIVEMVNKWLTRRCASRAGIGCGRKRANPAPRTTSRLMHQGAPKFVSRSTDLSGKFAGLVELELAFRCPGRGQSAVDEKAHSLSVVMAGHSHPKDGVLSHTHVPAITFERVWRLRLDIELACELRV